MINITEDMNKEYIDGMLGAKDETRISLGYGDVLIIYKSQVNLSIAVRGERGGMHHTDLTIFPTRPSNLKTLMEMLHEVQKIREDAQKSEEAVLKTVS